MSSSRTIRDLAELAIHDASVHAIAFGADDDTLSFDIDYIIEWIEVASPTPSFRYLIAPATLVFSDVRRPEMHIVSTFAEGLQILDLEREPGDDPDGRWAWLIHGDDGDITFLATGFTLDIR